MDGDWSLPSLKHYIESRMDEREKTHRSQLDSAERCIALAADALRDKLEHMNQFRQQIDAERALYVKRDQMDALLASRQVIVEQLIGRLEKLETWQANMLGRQLVFGGAVIALAGIVTLVLRLVGH